MNTNNQGNLGEARVLVHLVENGYTVFVPFGEASVFDLVAYKDGNLYKVSVKSSSSKKGNKYTVRLTQSGFKTVDGMRVNTHQLFDAESIDILAVYLVQDDRVVLVDPKTIKTKWAVNMAV